MRRIITGLLTAALVFGLAVAEPVQAKVYKMTPEERSAALKEKKTQRKKAKKSGKAAPGHDQGGWVEVKPGEKLAKKNRKSKVDELAKAAEEKGNKNKKNKRDAAPKPGKAAKADKALKDEKKPGKGKKAVVEDISGKKDKPGNQSGNQPNKQEKQTSAKKSGRKSASYGDRVVGKDYTGERKVSASSTEVRRTAPVPAPAPTSAPAATPGPVSAPAPAAAPSATPAAQPKVDDLSGYSVNRPGQHAAPAVPQVRQEVQPGPVDAARPVGTEHKAGEGRF